MDIEDWQAVVELWRSQNRDLRHLEVPPELAARLGVPLELTKTRSTDTEPEIFESEDEMAKKNVKQTTKKSGKKATKTSTKKKSAPKISTDPKASSDPTPVATDPRASLDRLINFDAKAAMGQQPTQPGQATEYKPIGKAEGEPKWKKRSAFSGDDCGYAGCTHKANGYVPGIRSTKDGERDKRSLWYGPACIPCIRKYHDSLMPMTLAELAHQRNGASDLAGVLDIEVGEVHKRLVIANCDEKGRPLNGQGDTMQNAQAPIVVAQQAPAGTAIVAQPEQHNITVVVPYDVLAATRQEMSQSAHALAPFVIRSQGEMDYASGYMQRVKGLWKQIDDLRKDMARPFNAVVDQIQAHFKPVLEDLKAVEATIKGKIEEGMAYSASQTAQGFQAAQAALAAGDQQGVAVGTQQAMGADLSLSKGVSMRPRFRFEVQDPTHLPGAFWSPDATKIQAALDALDPAELQQLLAAGYTPIPGCRVWQDNIIASRAA